jgi:hypothetical protein
VHRGPIPCLVFVCIAVHLYAQFLFLSLFNFAPSSVYIAIQYYSISV